MAMNEQAINIWNLINTGGVIATLVVTVVMFMRGDLLPRRVYEELTTRILNDLCTRVLGGVRDVIREERERAQDGGTD
jgi:hypothetical protein